VAVLTGAFFIMVEDKGEMKEEEPVEEKIDRLKEEKVPGKR